MLAFQVAIALPASISSAWFALWLEKSFWRRPTSTKMLLFKWESPACTGCHVSPCWSWVRSPCAPALCRSAPAPTLQVLENSGPKQPPKTINVSHSLPVFPSVFQEGIGRPMKISEHSWDHSETEREGELTTWGITFLAFLVSGTDHLCRGNSYTHAVVKGLYMRFNVIISYPTITVSLESPEAK